MQDGLNFSIVLSGATLVSVLGLALKVFLAKQPQRIEQPIEVKRAAGSTDKEQCDERHKVLDSQASNLFSRMSAAEQRIATLEGTIKEVKEQYRNIDDKLTVLLRRK
jgi:uncharacterized protein HemX